MQRPGNNRLWRLRWLVAYRLPFLLLIYRFNPLLGQGRSQEFDLGAYVLTSHCNIKTYVNVPHVNIISYRICPGSQEKNNHIIFFKVD